MTAALAIADTETALSRPHAWRSRLGATLTCLDMRHVHPRSLEQASSVTSASLAEGPLR